MSAEIKLELLGLIDQAVADGWAHARACRVLDLVDSRAHHWRQRLRETARSRTAIRGGGAVHGILPCEEQAVLDLIERWGWVDRSHRKLAHPGSSTGVVFVSPSTVLRVALKNRVQLPGEPFRPRAPKPAFPEISWETNRIWIWDASHFTRCKRVAYAIVDVVTRYWIGYLLTNEQTHTQVQLLSARALEDQGLLGADELPPKPDGEGPILVADQAQIESCSSHLKGDWPNLTSITDPAALDSDLARIRTEYITSRSNASIGYRPWSLVLLFSRDELQPFPTLLLAFACRPICGQLRTAILPPTPDGLSSC